MDEQEGLRITAEVLMDETPVTVQLTYKSMWFLISAVQLLTRHPGVSQAQKDLQKDIAFDLQALIVAKHPDADYLLEMGWNDDNDVGWDDGADYGEYDDDDYEDDDNDGFDFYPPGWYDPDMPTFDDDAGSKYIGPGSETDTPTDADDDSPETFPHVGDRHDEQ